MGSSLANDLADRGHDVTVIDKRQESLDQLGKSFNGSTIRGNGYDVDTLKRAGIEDADVFVAVTDDDNANLMAVQVAKVVYGVDRAIARLYEPSREESYRALDVQYVTGTRLVSNVVLELIVDPEFQYHLTFAAGDVEIVEMRMGGQAEGLTVDELETPGALRVAAVQRQGRTMIPEEGFLLRDGDLVVGAARRGAASKVRQYLREEDP